LFETVPQPINVSIAELLMASLLALIAAWNFFHALVPASAVLAQTRLGSGKGQR